jgi:hypothetical protein
MNIVTRPPSDANGVGHAGDDLDEVLSAFFRSQMPAPWPRLNLDSRRVRPAQPVAAPSRRPWFRSPRFALAASVALLIGGYAFLSATLTAPVPDTERIEQPSAKGHGPRAGAPSDDADVDMGVEKLDSTHHVRPR